MNVSAVRTGTSLGRYRLEELLSRGGMGEVWRGYDTTLGRPVAVKVLHAGVSDPDDRERFLREARAAAQLSHRHVVAVFDVGEWSGRPFLVMELLDGRTLAAELTQRGPLPVDEVRDLGAQTAAALQAAHGAGVVHRDIKPSNLMRSLDGTLKVVDFGIARVLDEASTRLTRTGTVVGTAAYLAPEQARGHIADARSDLYALGCVLYQLLCGRTPFVGGSTEVVYAHLHTEPTPPSRLRSDVPPDLDHLILSLLAKEPTERPVDAARVQSILLGRAEADTDEHAVPQDDPGAPTMVHPMVVAVPNTENPASDATRTMAVAADPGGDPPRTRAAGTRPRRKVGAAVTLVIASLVAVALLGGAVWAWRSANPLGGRPVANDATSNPTPSATPSEPKTTPSSTPTPPRQTTSTASDSDPLAIGSPAWLNRLDTTLALLASTGRIAPDLADNLRDTIDDARSAYAKGDSGRARDKIEDLRKDLSNAFQDRELPTSGQLMNLLGSGWLDEQSVERVRDNSNRDDHGKDRGDNRHRDNGDN
ncbi:hypothetical protein GCM10023317_44780 [Actinopolymorpha pittospori]